MLETFVDPSNIFHSSEPYKTTNHISESSDEGQITPGRSFAGQVDATPQSNVAEAWNGRGNDAENVNAAVDPDPTMPVDLAVDPNEDADEAGTLDQSKNSTSNLNRDYQAPSEDLKATVDGVLLTDDANLTNCDLDMSQQASREQIVTTNICSVFEDCFPYCEIL